MGQDLPCPEIGRLRWASVARPALGTLFYPEPEERYTRKDTVQGPERAEIHAPKPSAKERRKEDQPEENEAEDRVGEYPNDPNVRVEEWKKAGRGKYGNNHRPKHDERGREADKKGLR
ncbi:MAG: hypothetical protein ABSG21_12550 [Spirochaetia bacterium]|jgi:hypothetical protein